MCVDTVFVKLSRMRFGVRALVKLTSCARSNFILHAIRIVTTYNVLNYICECEFHYFLRISRKKKVIFHNYYLNIKIIVFNNYYRFDWSPKISYQREDACRSWRKRKRSGVFIYIYMFACCVFSDYMKSRKRSLNGSAKSMIEPPEKIARNAGQIRS